MRLPLLFFMTLTALLPAACLPVRGDRILGSDLAAADRRLASLPPTEPFSYAPMPGSKRVFMAAELERIARANGIAAADFAGACFEVPLHVPAEAEFIASMRQSLPGEAKLRLADMGRAAIPAGRLEFPLSGLEPPAVGNDDVQLWRGFVQYSDTRRIAVWARVAVSVTYMAVVALKDLSADTPIDKDALRIETYTGPLKRGATATRIEEVAGRVVHRPIKGGSEIPLSFLEDPPAVRRGDVVRVEVQSGLAVLHFDAVAETTVRAGQYADFRNPVTGKTFRARAEIGPRAIVIVGKGPA